MAGFAVWEDGTISLHSTAYDVNSTIAKVDAMSVPRPVKDDLVALLRTGSVREDDTKDVHFAKS